MHGTLEASTPLVIYQPPCHDVLLQVLGQLLVIRMTSSSFNINSTGNGNSATLANEHYQAELISHTFALFVANDTGLFQYTHGHLQLPRVLHSTFLALQLPTHSLKYLTTSGGAWALLVHTMMP
jgi:hypothetical protein